MPLTVHHAKPAVRFGGHYRRLMDLTLSNCVNSDVRQMLVLPQSQARLLLDARKVLPARALTKENA